MKYALAILCLVGFAACTKKEPTTFMCFNPFTLLQSFQIDTDHPRVKVRHSTLELTLDDGGLLIVPKNLCVEVIHAASH